MDVGKVYQHPKGGIIQILAYHLDADKIEIYGFGRNKIVRTNLSTFLRDWYLATWLPNHPGIGKVCEDCREFCRQQCQIPEIQLAKAVSKYQELLTSGLTPYQAERVVHVLVNQIKAKTHEQY